MNKSRILDICIVIGYILIIVVWNLCAWVFRTDDMTPIFYFITGVVSMEAFNTALTGIQKLIIAKKGENE